jgi:hypothetical protein
MKEAAKQMDAIIVSKIDQLYEIFSIMKENRRLLFLVKTIVNVSLEKPEWKDLTMSDFRGYEIINSSTYSSLVLGIEFIRQHSNFVKNPLTSVLEFDVRTEKTLVQKSLLFLFHYCIQKFDMSFYCVKVVEKMIPY